MKRRLITIAIFVLAGAVVNVAVALVWSWGSGFTWNQANLVDVQRWPLPVPADWPAPNTGVVIVHHGWTSLIVDSQSGDHIWRLSIHQSGWPFRALEYRRLADGLLNSMPTSTARLPEWLAGEAIIPARPVWPGFAFNTLIYAVILAALYLIVRGGYALAFRRLIRVRRGLCPNCAYPMGESAVCSECGKALREPAQ